MKNMKKIVALVLALMMVLGMTAALAVPDSQSPTDGNAPDATTGKYTISVNSSDTHTYRAYQILTGSLITGQNKLGDPVWGADAKSATGTDTGVKAFIESITVAGLSNAAINKLVEAELASNATGVGPIDKDHSVDVDPGYYLIVDTTQNLAQGDSKSLNIVAVFNDIEIAAKRGTTTSDKEVDDENDSIADPDAGNEDGTAWQDSADYDIGDAVPFKLTATIAEDYANYTYAYKLTFHDDMSAGLTFNSSSVVVKVDGVELKDGYQLVTTGLSDSCDFEVKFTDLKTLTKANYKVLPEGATATDKIITAGSVITVEFTATLNGNAAVNTAGNTNESHVTYTNNPNDDQSGEYGTTPPTTVVVFTYKTVFNKVDADGKALAGADFTLSKYDAATNTYVNVTNIHTGDGAVNPSKTASKSNESLASNDVFTFSGLDDGKYKLEETQVPKGYNKMADLIFWIVATHAEDPAHPGTQIVTGFDIWNEAKTEKLNPDDFAITLTAGEDISASANITNTQGAELPSTGGMGTTILYIGGSILVILAAVLLITKRRMNAED